jgi:Peptidase M50B-like
MSASSLAAALQRIGEIQPRLPGPAAGLIAIAAIGAVLLPDVWLVARHVTVMAHEGAHATMGSVIGRRITAVRLLRNADGRTSYAPGGAAGNFVVTAVGYLGPSGFGIGAAELIRVGHIVAVLWLGLVALIMLMVPLRASFGVVSVLCTFLLLFGVAGFATAGAQVVAAYGIAWFLLVSGVRIITIRGKDAGDAGILHGMTRIPHGFWFRLWLIGSLAALGFGAKLLI